MNCVNCGAPPRRGAEECHYCETPLDEKAPRANQAGFRAVMRAIKSFSFDSDRLTAVRDLRGEFTAGQVQQILRMFTFDSDRLDAGHHLVPRTINPGMLFEVAELFTFDSDRAAFVRAVSRIAHVGDASVEDERELVDEDDRTRAQARRTRVPPWGIIVLAVAAVVSTLKAC